MPLARVWTHGLQIINGVCQDPTSQWVHWGNGPIQSSFLIQVLTVDSWNSHVGSLVFGVKRRLWLNISCGSKHNCHEAVIASPWPPLQRCLRGEPTRICSLGAATWACGEWCPWYKGETVKVCHPYPSKTDLLWDAITRWPSSFSSFKVCAGLQQAASPVPRHWEVRGWKDLANWAHHWMCLATRGWWTYPFTVWIG